METKEQYLTQLATRTKQLLLYKRVLTAAIAFCSALFELATGEKAPKAKDALRD